MTKLPISSCLCVSENPLIYIREYERSFWSTYGTQIGNSQYFAVTLDNGYVFTYSGLREEPVPVLRDSIGTFLAWVLYSENPKMYLIVMNDGLTRIS